MMPWQMITQQQQTFLVINYKSPLTMLDTDINNSFITYNYFVMIIVQAQYLAQ